MHRGDEDALRAKNEVLERELADARAELARARAPRVDPGPSAASRWVASIPQRVRAGIGWLAPSTAARWGWSRAVALGLWVALITVSTAVLVSVVVAFSDASSSPDGAPAFWVVLAWLFLGPGALTCLAAYLLAAPSPKIAGAIGGIAVFVVSLAPSAHPVLRDGVRMLVLGDARGGLDEVAAQPRIAWAHLEPAWIGPQIGEGVSVNQHTDSEGRTTTSSTERFCVPLLPSPGWLGPVHFVCCDDERASLPVAPGAGVIEGRVTRAFTPDDRAVAALAAQGVAIAPEARVVTLTGPREQTLGLGLVAFALASVLGAILGAAITVRAAVARDG